MYDLLDQEIQKIILLVDRKEQGQISQERRDQITQIAYERYLGHLSDEIKEVAYQSLTEKGRDDLVERFKSIKIYPNRNPKKMDYFLNEMIQFIDQRTTRETDAYDRNVTIELAYDRFIAKSLGGGLLGLGDILVKLQKCGRDDIFRRFGHLVNISNFDLDTLARNAVEAEAPRAGFGR